MRLRFATIALVCAIALILMATAVQAQPSVTVTPGSISPNDKVKITVTSNADGTTIDKITVTDPDGNSYIKDYSPDMILSDGQTQEEYFGTGVSSWTPVADTSREGWYKVIVEGSDPSYFDVSRKFYVPEFPVASAALTAIGFSILNIVRKFEKKRT